MKTLREYLPFEFSAEFSDTRAATMIDRMVVKENDGTAVAWPGRERNVFTWWELSNGYAVGWNENPSRGWSFPVLSLRRKL